MGQLGNRVQLCVDMACEMIGYCRICAQRHHDLVSVFDEQGTCKQLFLKLQICLQMNVMKHAHLPTTICSSCAAKLEVCYELMRLRVLGENKFNKIQIASDRTNPTNRETEVCLNRLGTDQLMVKPMDPPVPELSAKGRKPKTRWILSGLSMLNSSPEAGPSHGEASKVCSCERCTSTPSSQYGALPLLAEVSEQSSQLSVHSASGPSSPAQNFEQQTSKLVTSGRTRTMKREIECEYCGKSFNHTGDLNKHRRSHTGERPYPCKDCNKRFSHASNLLRHRKIHSGERPFNCPTCGKGFSRKDKMLSHIKSAVCVRRSESSASSVGSPSSLESSHFTRGFYPPTSTS